MNAITPFLLAALSGLGAVMLVGFDGLLFAIAEWTLAVAILLSLKMANAWQKFVIVRRARSEGYAALACPVFAGARRDSRSH